MAKTMTKSYAFNGKVDTDIDSWRQWVDDALALCKMFGYAANYYDAGTLSIESRGISPIGGIKRKINNAEKKNDTIMWMSILFLPEDFSSAIFDAKIAVSRYASPHPEFVSYETLMVEEECNASVEEDVIVEMLKRNINADSGEIYEMAMSECPQLYAAKANPKEYYKTLKVLKSLL